MPSLWCQATALEIGQAPLAAEGKEKATKNEKKCWNLQSCLLRIDMFFSLNCNSHLACVSYRLRLREMMRRSLRAAGLGRHESGPSSSDHQDPVSPPIAPPSWVPDPPPMDPG